MRWPGPWTPPHHGVGGGAGVGEDWTGRNYVPSQAIIPIKSIPS